MASLAGNTSLFGSNSLSKTGAPSNDKTTLTAASDLRRLLPNTSISRRRVGVVVDDAALDCEVAMSSSESSGSGCSEARWQPPIKQSAKTMVRRFTIPPHLYTEQTHLTHNRRSPSLPRMSGLTYRDAGVDIEAADRLVDRIKHLAASTRSPLVIDDVGGFAGLCRLPSGIDDPVLVSGTDGVGTKLRLALDMGRHDTVGIDLVAMCVNDVITTGASPLFFLDYFATGQLDVDQAESVVRGIAEGCRQAGCALLGGETAELPGFYDHGDYDLAGFAVGVVSRAAIVDGKGAQEGDAIIGVASTGLHSNGYSLARKVLLDGKHAMSLSDSIDGYDRPIGDVLLEPTRIYASFVERVLVHEPAALCHITGGGLAGNLPRVLPPGLGVVIERGAWTPPPIFDLVRTKGEVSEDEMYATFNMGIGFAVIVHPDRAETLVRELHDSGEQCWVIGRVERVADGPRARFE